MSPTAHRPVPVRDALRLMQPLQPGRNELVLGPDNSPYRFALDVESTA